MTQHMPIHLLNRRVPICGQHTPQFIHFVIYLLPSLLFCSIMAFLPLRNLVNQSTITLRLIFFPHIAEKSTTSLRCTPRCSSNRQAEQAPPSYNDPSNRRAEQAKTVLEKNGPSNHHQAKTILAKDGPSNRLQAITILATDEASINLDA